MSEHHDSQPDNHTSSDSGHKGEWRKNVTLAIEVLGLCALVVYTFFSILQWAQIRWTNKLTREALNGSSETLERTLAKLQGQIDAANRLYTEAQKQTGEEETARVTQIEIQRPFVLPIDFKSRRLLDGSLIFVETWQNMGQTPANNFKASWTWDNSLPETLSRVVWKSSTGSTGSSLPVNATAHDELAVSSSAVAEIERQHHFFTFGRVTYGDYFPDHSQILHLVEYCADVSQVGDTNANFGNAWLVRNCKKFNCIDRGCGADYARIVQKAKAAQKTAK